MGMIRRSHLRIDKDKYYPGQYYSGDCTGPKESSIVDGYTFALLLVEFHTRLKTSYFGVEKTAAVIISLLEKWDEDHLSIWRYVHRNVPNFWFHLLCDNLELKYPEVVHFLHSIGVRPHFTCPGHSSTNGLAERAIQTIDLKERTYRIKKNLPDSFWAASWDIATHLSNVVVWKYHGRYHKDPYSDYYGRVWDYSLLQEPLSKCFVTIRNRLKTEEVQKSLQGIFCGYGKDTNAYTVYIPSTNTFTTSGDVYFPREDDYLELLVDEEEVTTESATPTSTSAEAEQAMKGVNKSGIIIDFESWVPCAVRFMENF